MRLALPLLLLVACCQPVPHPFADDAPLPRSPFLTPRDSNGVVVAPLAGAPAPAGERLAEAMAAALRDADIPASTAGGNKRSYRLIAVAREQPRAGGRSVIAVDWELRAADGRTLGRATGTAEAATAAWRDADETVARDIASKAAPAIVSLLQDEPPAMVPEATVALRPVTGAPGDGDRSLTRAMDDALRRAHVALGAEKDSFVLAGKVEMSPPDGNRQQVKVSWALLRPDGGEIGQVSQQNAVPAGSLNGAWSDVAYAVANAALPGVTALIERAKAVDAQR
jgi:hypothetical protein